jgi:arabinose-5-phosphate isomerase
LPLHFHRHLIFTNHICTPLAESVFWGGMTAVAEHTYGAEVAHFLRLEADAIHATATRLDALAVQRAIGLLLSCQGQLVVTGVGKSGDIAQKIAATLTSTGTPAVFLHPSDAMHGGLGLVRAGDVVIAISNSGETDEICAMLPALLSRATPVIALTGNLRSTLARHAAVMLDASVDQEACPLNLAPTASTTVALALGDALALTLMQAKGLTPEDFAINHPAGRLGKRLTLRVADLLPVNGGNPAVGPDDSWMQVLAAITNGGDGAANVVDATGRLLGLITDGDLRRTVLKTAPEQLHALQARAIMTPGPTVATPDMLAYDALRLMEDRPRQISVLPVVDETGACLGLLRLHDIVRSGL